MTIDSMMMRIIVIVKIIIMIIIMTIMVIKMIICITIIQLVTAISIMITMITVTITTMSTILSTALVPLHLSHNRSGLPEVPEKRRSGKLTETPIFHEFTALYLSPMFMNLLRYVCPNYKLI